MSRFSQQRDAVQRHGYSRIWKRPGRFATVLVGLTAVIVGVVLERHGFAWKFTDVGFTTVLLVWLLLSGFRPEWHRIRFWVVFVAIIAAHIAGWWWLTSTVAKVGFPLMFVTMIAELVASATLIVKVIPEDEKAVDDYIDQW